LSALELPAKPLPDRNDIRDVGIRRMERLMKQHSRSGSGAEACYVALLARINAVSRVDPEGGRSIVRTALAMAAGAVADFEETYLSADEILTLVLTTHDRDVAPTVPGQTWQADPRFHGREQELAVLEGLLKPGSPDPVPPVVLRGMPGAGKTALALQFTAQNSGVFKPIFIKATSRADVSDELRRLWGASVREVADPRLPGPAAPALPGTSATLLIIDGVQDATVVRGLIPTAPSLSRVIITTTRDLGRDFTEIPVDIWAADDGRAYVEAVWDEASADDATALVLGLHGHPLAITQAIGYCQTVGVSVGEYLAQLAEFPEVTLETDLSDTIASSVLGAIRMSVHAARQRNAEAFDLLGLVALLGADDLGKLPVGSAGTGIPESLLNDAPPVVSFLQAAGRDPGGLLPSPESEALWSLVHDPARRRRAILTLRRLSLLDMPAGGLSVHPLVKVVFESEAEDLRPWLEVGFGIFAHYFAQVDDPPVRNPAIDLPVLARLVDASLRHQMSGTAVYVAMILLAPWIAGRRDATRARRYAELALRWATSLPDDRPSAVTRLAARDSLAEALMLDGDVPGALKLYAENAAESDALGDVSIGARVLCDQALAAVFAKDAPVMRSCLEQLSEPSFTELDGEEDVAVRTTRARLLLELGDPAAARSEVQRAFDDFQALSPAPMLRLHLLQTAAAVAAVVDATGSESDRFNQELLAAVREIEGDDQTLAFATVLISAADAAIDGDALDRAAALLDEVERMQASNPASRDGLEHDVIALRGRIQLHRARVGEVSLLDDARENIGRAIALKRQLGQTERQALASALVNYAQVLGMQGQFQYAERALQEAGEIDSDVFGPEHHETQTDLNELRHLKEERANAKAAGFIDPVVEFHPRRAVAVGAVARFAVPPPLVPLLLLDFGLSEEPEHASIARAILLAHGLSAVRSMNDVYPSAVAWSYKITPGSEGLHKIRVAGPGSPPGVVFDGVLVADDVWLSVEASLKRLVLAAANFGFRDLLTSGPRDLELVIEEALATDDVVGATIARTVQRDSMPRAGPAVRGPKPRTGGRRRR
jgi:tetratricopeptide (TPR) repeat protein